VFSTHKHTNTQTSPTTMKAYTPKRRKHRSNRAHNKAYAHTLKQSAHNKAYTPTRRKHRSNRPINGLLTTEHTTRISEGHCLCRTTHLRNNPAITRLPLTLKQTAHHRASTHTEQHMHRNNRPVTTSVPTHIELLPTRTAGGAVAVGPSV
jgi:hypothetical protein